MPDDEAAEPAEPDSEAVYRWTIRALYAVAIGLNVWLLWDQVRDNPDAEIWRRTWQQRIERAWTPVRDRLHFRRHVNAVLFEAEQVLDDASA